MSLSWPYRGPGTLCLLTLPGSIEQISLLPFLAVGSLSLHTLIPGMPYIQGLWGPCLCLKYVVVPSLMACPTKTHLVNMLP